MGLIFGPIAGLLFASACLIALGHVIKTGGSLLARLYLLAGLCFTVSLANVLTWCGVESVLGGSIEMGKVEGDSYFLGAHGKYIPVSAQTYRRFKAYGDITTQLAVATTPTFFLLRGALAIENTLRGRNRRPPAPG